MTSRKNRWHETIIRVLDASDTPMTPAKIWDAMVASGFRHNSVRPRSTLGGRLAELCILKTVVRVGNALYRRATPAHHAPPVADPGVPEDLHSYN